MAVTQLNTNNISDIERNDLNTTKTGQAVITKVVAGTGINISSTGIDAGTGDVTIVSNPSDVTNSNVGAPSSGLVLEARLKSGRRFLTSVDPNGMAEELQSAVCYKKIAWAESGWSNGSGFYYFGMTSFTNTGTLSSNTMASGMSGQTFRQQTKRFSLASTATAGSTASFRCPIKQFWRGNAGSMGGFFLSIKFAFPIVQTGWTCFVGATQNTSAMALTAAAAPSLEAHSIGIGKDTGDLNFQIISNDGTGGTATKFDTGIALDTETVYAVRIYCRPNDTYMYVCLEDIQTGVIFEQVLSTSNAKMPASTGSMTFQGGIGNNATAAAVTINPVQVYLESNN